MRKTICYFIFILIICIFTQAVNAASTDVFSISDASGAKGEEVTVYIKLEQELEFASADLTVEYDTSKLEFVKYDELEIFEKSAMNIVQDDPSTGKIAIGYVSKPNPTDLQKTPGQMLSITFKIKNDDYETTQLNLKCRSVKKDSGEDVEASDVQSKITISKKSDNDDTQEKPDDTQETTDDTQEETEETSEGTSEETSEDEEIEETSKGTQKISYEVKEAENPKRNNGQPDETLPKTGENKSIIAILIAGFISISIYSYKKYKLLRKI